MLDDSQADGEHFQLCSIKLTEGSAQRTPLHGAVLSSDCRASFAQHKEDLAAIRWMWLTFDQPFLLQARQDVWVKGLPHDTTAIIRWSATDTSPVGSPYRNHGVHIIKMRWGKVVDIDAHADSQAVAESLAKQATMGVAEAIAPQIVSKEPSAITAENDV